MNLEPYRAFMIELAHESGDFIRPFFADHSVDVETKADESPVTVADRGAEELMRQKITRHFPSHGIIGEEYGTTNAEAEFVWVLDPIDGTKSFMSACPLFGTLIALLHEGQPVLGSIHQPILRQLMIGDGVSTILNARTVKVRSRMKIEEASLLTSDPLNPAKYQNGERYNALTHRARLVRTWGDCYGYLLVASGWADIMIDPIMNPWDIQALVPIVRGAGGIITDWQGRDPVKGNSIVAAHPNLHSQVVDALNA